MLQGGGGDMGKELEYWQGRDGVGAGKGRSSTHMKEGKLVPMIRTHSYLLMYEHPTGVSQAEN